MNPRYESLLDAQMRAYVADCEAFSAGFGPEPSLAQIRSGYNALAAAMRAERPAGLQVSDGQVGGVPIRVYGSGHATVLFIHGGGFALGDLESHDDVCAEIAAETGLRVVALAYRLAPEHPHPAQLTDCEAVLSWISERFGLGIVLAGDSAGGTLAAVLAARHRHRGLLGQVLIYPALSGGRGADGAGSYAEHADAPLLTRADMEQFRGYLAAPKGDMAPLDGPEFRGLPPTLALSAEQDPLADDARDYVKALAEAGVVARWEPGLGLVHSYLRARHRSDRAGAAFQTILQAIRDMAKGTFA